MNTQFTLLLLSVLIHLSFCALGVDLYGSYSVATFKCIKNAGYSFAILRGYRSFGGLDTTAAKSLENAKSAGLATDIYMFPCRGKNASAQVDELVKGINGSLYDRIWVDIENNPSSGCSWSGNGRNSTSNCQFVTQLINRLNFHKKKIGIYTSATMWESIFGSRTACTAASAYDLWYAHYNKVQSFASFSAFGGWTKPVMKQHVGDTTVCGADVDKNWRP